MPSKNPEFVTQPKQNTNLAQRENALRGSTLRNTAYSQRLNVNQASQSMPTKNPAFGIQHKQQNTNLKPFDVNRAQLNRKIRLRVNNTFENIKKKMLEEVII